MIFDFANGTAKQQTLWKEAIGYLLHLPGDALPLTAAIEFVPSLSGPNATSFAETEWGYGATAGSMRVRNDAPGFGGLDATLVAEAASMGLRYNATTHFHETAAHETGHAVFAAIPHSRRLEVAALFGAQTDDPAVLQPAGAAWQNRIGEGIAETFKEAFLPARYRVFPNRTNHKISYALYPMFRRIIREGLEEIGGGGGEAPADSFRHDVLELDERNLRVAWLHDPVFQNVASNTYTTTYEAGYDLFEFTMPADHLFGLQFKMPLLPVVKDAGLGFMYLTIFFGFRYIIKVNGVVKDEFRGVWGAGRPTSPDELRFWIKWRSDSLAFDDPGDRVNASLSAWESEGERFFLPNEVEHEGEGWTNNYALWEDAKTLRGGGPLPNEYLSSVVVKPGDVVSIHCRALGVEYASPGGPDFEEEAKADMVRFNSGPWASALPLMFYRTSTAPSFCYPYFSDQFPDESGNDWAALHKGDRDDEAFVTYSGIPEFDGDWGVDMSQFPESSILPYSIEVEEGITT